MIYPGFRRWLPADHADRTAAQFGSHETRPAPRLRTHAETVLLGTAADKAHDGGVKPGSTHDPTLNSGVIGVSPLARLPYWNLMRGLVLDTMHLTLNCLKHLFEVMKGKRRPAKPAPPKPAAAKGSDGKESKEDLLKATLAQSDYAAKLEEWSRHSKQHDAWTLSAQQQNAVDARLSTLLAPSGLVSRSRLPFRRQGEC